MAGIQAWAKGWASISRICYAVLYASTSDARWHEMWHGTAFKTDWPNNMVHEIASFMVLREATVWRWSHTRRDICGHRCWRASTGCLRSSAAGAAGAAGVCARLPVSQSRRRCGRYWRMSASQQLHQQSHPRAHHRWRRMHSS